MQKEIYSEASDWLSQPNSVPVGQTKLRNKKCRKT